MKDEERLAKYIEITGDKWPATLKEFEEKIDDWVDKGKDDIMNAVVELIVGTDAYWAF